MVGDSAAMQSLRETIMLVARSNRSVLVTGPTGVGKELVVRAIHAASACREGPLLELNCGALPAMLTESELFGHERGAFTGADRRNEGFIAAAAGGTMFLDEIGELALDLQVKLLRVLDQGSYRRLGSTSTSSCSARVIAATHADLCSRVAERRFRADLYYRLSILEVRVPALAERTGDIPALAKYFAAQQPVPLSFTEDALATLQEMQWPGNVRQLRNMIDRLSVFTPGVVDAAALTGMARQMRKPDPLRILVRQVLLSPRDDDKVELAVNSLVAHALRETNGNKTAAARLLGVHRKVLERRLSKNSPSATDGSYGEGSWT